MGASTHVAVALYREYAALLIMADVYWLIRASRNATPPGI